VGNAHAMAKQQPRPRRCRTQSDALRVA